MDSLGIRERRSRRSFRRGTEARHPPLRGCYGYCSVHHEDGRSIPRVCEHVEQKRRKKEKDRKTGFDVHQNSPILLERFG